MKNKKISLIIIILIALITGAALTVLVFKFVPMGDFLPSLVKSEKEVTVNENGIADAVDKVYDSVVTVETYAKQQKISSGTGFVYKVENGKALILTNEHVIEGGDEIHLLFTNGKNVVAKVVGSDNLADIAVLEVDESEIISKAELGSSVDTRVGDTVFAVGAPLNSEYSWTVTRGILSGKDRMIEVQTSNTGNNDWIMKVLQTDTAINSGNSGGPLSNSNGEVIGITSMKLVSSGVESMGFAIPIEDALEIATRIENGETKETPYLGVSMVNTNDIYTLYQLGFDINSIPSSGVVIATVGDPAQSAGMKKNDVITKINGDEVSSIAELRYYLYKYNPGDTIEVELIRDSKEMTIEVKLDTSN